MEEKQEINLEQKPTTPPNATIHLLTQYIRALSDNVNKKTLPTSLNLIFDSGAVEGIVAIGTALYIHHLEKNSVFKINKVSGCSIGSMIALWYICGCPEEIYTFMEDLFAYYKREKNFYIYEQTVRNMVSILIKEEDISTLLNGRLYITYYDTKKCKQKVVSRFKNSQHLVRCILRSSHVPFITSRHYKCQGRYIDGITPYIFPDTDKTKNLFIQLIELMNPLQCMRAKTDKNIYARLIRGVSCVNDFFMNGNSTRCSYINNKSYLIHLQLYIRKCFILFFIFLIDWIITIKNNMPLALIIAVEESTFYNKCVCLSKQCWVLIQNKLV